jgi:hypothetical protein
MALARQCDHSRAKVHPHTAGRLDRRQQITQAAAHLQHPQPGRDPEGVLLAQQLLVVAIRFPHPQERPLVVECTPVDHRGKITLNCSP